MDYEYIKAAYKRIDQLDSGDFARRFTEDGRLTFGNAPPAIGGQAIKAALDGFFTLVAGMHHEFVRTWRDETSWALEAAVTYSLKTGAEVTICGVTVLRAIGDQLTDVRIYYDMAPVFAASRRASDAHAPTAIQHRHDDTEGEFFVDAAGRVASMAYSRAGTAMLITHTWVSDSHRGAGLGAQLLDAAARFARANNLRVLPLCPFARAMFAKNPALRDVLA